MTISAKRWKKNKLPKRILAIRLQAMGDVVITLPYLQHLKRSLPPDTIVDLLTRTESAGIPDSLLLFDNIFVIAGGRNFRKQFLYTLLLLPRLLSRRYDVVIDLQNNLLSRIVRKAIAPHAWAEFDRYSPIPAGERNRKTIEAVGLGIIAADTGFAIKPLDSQQLLESNGWTTGSPIIILNPAGAFENRNWPIDNYIAFANLWLQQEPTAQFLILGVDKIADKAKALKAVLGDRLINLVNKTNPSVAFSLMQHGHFVLSEDSGLMHMAWVSGVPTLAIFGSTRSDWSRPLGAHTDFLNSSDLECGGCMLEHCRFGGDRKNFCMLRFKPEFVFERAQALLNHLSASSANSE